MTRNERAHAYLLALIADASAFKWKDVDDMVLIAFDLADAFEAKAAETSTPLPEIEKPQADEDGWIEWEGGERPIDDGCRFAIRLRYGQVYLSSKPASWYGWKHNGGALDIIAYKVLA